MEKFFQYKKSKLEIETRNEFYLNPKDMINNDKINENLKCDVFHYLPLNELFVLIFEENIAVIDIKQTISKNFTILKMTAFNDVYTQLFKPEITKVTKFPIQNSLSNFCYKIRENDLKKPKNCVFVETPCNIGKVYYIIEFSNLEFAVLKYNNINQQQQQQQSTTHYEVVHTHLKNYFLTLNTKMKIIYESPLIFNYNTSLTVVNTNSNSSNSSSSSSSNDVFYILHQVEMYLFIFELNCVDDTYKHKYTINGEGEVKLCKCMFNSSSNSNNTNEFVIASVTDMNKVYKQFFSVQTRSITQTMCIENANKGNITSLKYSSRYIIYIQLNRVYVYDNAIERKIRAITFHDFDDCVISYCCLFERLNVIYVFNANGDFVMCEFNSSNSNSSSNSNEQQCECVDVTSTKKTLSISKLIYAVIPFQNEFGFYILSTQNPIKLSNVSITYFIPDNLITNQTLFTLINNNINNNAVNNSFYTFTLCEYIIYALRYNATLIPDDDGSSSSLHIKRINYYITCILNTTTDKSAFITDILFHYRTHCITQPYEQYKTYLNNDNFKCDFCESEYTQYNTATNIYQCKNEHQSFACCVTQRPFHDDFLYCAYCNLFYSNTFKICLICQIMLDNAI